MATQERISAARLKAKVGRTLDVLVDQLDRDTAIARSASDAPEIDGLVYVRGGKRLKPGEFARVRITRSDQHDLWGLPADQ
jgi:ribosomal protein S12 methylthiotransferase